ncbi:hypothetical protein WJX73_003939 [Symbiochloris irregularis]|uniref:Uncharacterized protein n=1 Tax=Symbiochloris irregularis TaxID=706552 RepID=A0AAW1P7Q0_9CHLO
MAKAVGVPDATLTALRQELADEVAKLPEALSSPWHDLLADHLAAVFKPEDVADVARPSTSGSEDAPAVAPSKAALQAKAAAKHRPADLPTPSSKRQNITGPAPRPRGRPPTKRLALERAAAEAAASQQGGGNGRGLRPLAPAAPAQGLAPGTAYGLPAGASLHNFAGLHPACLPSQLPAGVGQAMMAAKGGRGRGSYLPAVGRPAALPNGLPNPIAQPLANATR